MTDIWGFLLQTLSVSLIAMLLLAVKRLLRDKLSPRWQYGVWSVLALRMVLPVRLTGRYVLLPLPLWLETGKALAEQTLRSAYSAVYMPIRIRFPVPWVGGSPASVTDWLFVIYAAGVLVLLLRYMVFYGRLRLLLRHGSPASAQVQARIDGVCRQYGLRSCRAVALAGLPSAFVCGVFRPVLAIPAGTEPDDKVLLHELLHLRYWDGGQSVVWSLFRALHWCNPFLQFVFDQIGNDMEQLCDQRVLERLEGEQRREYGGILLSMVNEKYPRAPGTSSLSNGGRNIAGRIESIARFQKYPRGMALVSVCTGVVLLGASLFGTYAQGLEVGGGDSRDSLGFARAMASARLVRCTTVEGALGTYAKGIMFENGVYLAAASPLSAQEALAQEMRDNAQRENWVYYHLQRGPEHLDRSGYWVYNLKATPDGGYEALLVFTADSLPGEDGRGTWCDENGDPYKGILAYPVKVSREGAWVVTENGARQVSPVSLQETPQLHLQYGSALLPGLAEYSATGESGVVTTRIQSVYTVDNAVESGAMLNFFGTTSFDETVKPDAQFAYCTLHTQSEYRFGGSDAERKGLETVGLQTAELRNADSAPSFQSFSHLEDSGGSSSDGSQWVNRIITEDWDGILTSGGGTGWSAGVELRAAELPYGYAARIFWNGALRETLILKEADPNGTAAAY